MKHLLRGLPLTAALALTAALPSIAQQTNAIEIPGYLNPRTGAFRPRPANVSPDVAAKAVTYTGTLEFEFTITVESKIPSGQEIDCEATASLVDVPTSGSFENEIIDQATAIATVKGDTATCTVKIPYSWSLSSGAEDSVSLTYALAIVPTSITNEPDATAVRRSSQYLAPIAVPKTGTTTTKTIDATL